MTEELNQENLNPEPQVVNTTEGELNTVQDGICPEAPAPNAEGETAQPSAESAESLDADSGTEQQENAAITDIETDFSNADEGGDEGSEDEESEENA